MSKLPNSLIINSPNDCPTQYLEQDQNGKVSTVVPGRRPAAYEELDTRNNTSRVEELETVNKIRERLDQWRSDGWIGEIGRAHV